MATGERKTYVTQRITSKLLLDNIGFKIDLHCTFKIKKIEATQVLLEPTSRTH